MNNARIQTLIKQAEKLTNSTSGNEFAVELAKLVAIECSKIAMSLRMSDGYADYDSLDPYDQGCDNTCSSVSHKILSSFSVL